MIGDCTMARHGGVGRKIVAHGCNDIGKWGKGFVLAVSATFGDAPRRSFLAWHRKGTQQPHDDAFGLGAVQFVTNHEGPEKSVEVCNMITQHGIMKNPQGPPAARYEAIEAALASLGRRAGATGRGGHWQHARSEAPRLARLETGAQATQQPWRS